MNEFIITTDINADLPKEYLEKNNIPVISLYYNIDDTVYGGNLTLNDKDFYSKMRAGSMVTTSACNPEETEKVFREQLEKGLDILHIAFSSALSSSFNTVYIVGQQLSEEYPDRKIVVIDSLCASLGQGLFLHKAVQQKAAGKSLEEIAEWLEANKLFLCHQFTVDDLHFLHRGGRVSKGTAIIGTLINVKPVLHVSDEGKLTPLLNVRGRKKALQTLVENMASRIVGYEDQNDTIFISHGDCIEDAEYVASLVKEKFGEKEILINYVGPTIGAHSGPGTVALFFMGSPR